jgi:hypothetical protein
MHTELLVNLGLAGIDDSTREILREAWSVLREHVPQVLDTMYGRDPARPGLSSLASGDSRMSEARAAQARHWQALFSARFDEEYAASVSRIALTHVRIGLGPAWFISGYLVALTELHSLLVNVHAESIMSLRSRIRMAHAIRAVDQAVLFDLQLGVSAYFAEIEAGYRRRFEDLAQRCEAVTATIGDRVLAAVGELDATADGLRDAADDARTGATVANVGATRVAAEVALAAAAAEQVTGLIDAAARQADVAAAETANAMAAADAVVRLTDQLTAATERINVVITAAAGPTVATGGMAAGLGAEIGTVRTAADGITSAIGQILAVLHGVRTAATALAGAVAGQAEAAREIGIATAGAARALAGLGHVTRSAAESAARTGAGARRFAAVSQQLRRQAGEQAAASGNFVAEIRAADRRAEPREPASASVILTTAEQEIRGVLQDVSAGGASVLLDASRIADDPGPMSLRVPQSARATRVTVADRTPHRLNLNFVDRDDAQSFLANVLDRSNSLAASQAA